ncbi:hypothetical protein PV327_008823 [Microctonus hyperodae]|uniref:ADAMTS cysteine-rich domain-containing protein n=1 Tax=Microctonus hyperodae TaxID=165561 RepID=A0AA39FST7_MICHY|nr:hypothetical protein PV327_008823 [Microctonus hyperodae]
MASTIELFDAICFILTLLFLMNGAQGEFPKSLNNATDHESSRTSGKAFGVYGTDYYIEGYPLRWDGEGYSLGIMDSTYVVKRENIPFQETLRPFDFINQCEIHFTELISKLPTYLKESSSSYPPDSFDHVFIVTDLSPDIDLLENEERLEWSQNSLHQFRAFFRQNPNRVFLRNKPRSLLPPGPHALITPEAQCRCLGYNYYRKGSTKSSPIIPMSQCTKPLQCNKEGIKLYNAPLWPLDGTPCSNKKVCWEGQCVLPTE